MTADRQIILYSLGMGLLLYTAFVDEYPYMANGCIIGTLILFMIYIFLPPLLDWGVRATQKKIEEILEKIETDSNIENTTADILTLIQLSARLIWWVRLLSISTYFYRSKTIRDSLIVYSEYIENRLLEIYRRFQRDLLLQMEWTQSQLHKVKTEIEILWRTPLWKNTLIVQRRIDNQIEQFEHLKSRLIQP